MTVYVTTVSFVIAVFTLVSCRQKPKPESKDYTKIKLVDSGRNDSVIDNKQRLYNASIPGPCLKCVVAAIRNSEPLKKYVQSADSSMLIYQVDWASGPKLRDSLKKAGSGLLIHVLRKKSTNPDTLAVFTFDNVTGQLYGEHREPVRLDSATRLKIRNACFWGVASGN